MPLARALVGLGLMNEDDLHEELSKSDGVPALTEVYPRIDLLQMLPTGLCNRLACVPVDLDEDGTVVVAVLDPRDHSIAEEMAHHLRRPARVVRAPYSILREALVNYATKVQSIVPPAGIRRERRRAIAYTPAWGTPIHTPVPPEPYTQGPVSDDPPPQFASVTTSTRRFFAGIHSEPPPAGTLPLDGSVPAPNEPVFDLLRPPSQTIPDIEPPTQRQQEAPAFLVKGSLPTTLPLPFLTPTSRHFPDPASTLGGLRASTERDEVLSLVEKSARAICRRVALLVVRKDALTGWSCSPEFGEQSALAAVSISTRTPSLFGSVKDGAVYLGPLLGSVGAALLAVMGSASRDVAMVAIRVKRKPTVLVVCDELSDTLLATRHLEIMAKVAGEALERILLARRG